ncbi:oligosaccharide flippase family protein [Micromonospora sp. CA-244673]|uniref:oligosaccharide flippase family protein n=1 Tax=Micromonospora sp. CA-244673 TaxID=3239958 RepID=UPI003D8DCEC8
MSQVVAVAASILLARFYTPREFGEFSVLLATSMIVATAATLRLEMAVPLAGDDREADEVASAAVAAVTAVAGLGLVGVAVYASLPATSVGVMPWLIPPAVAVTGAAAVGRMVQSRRNRFTVVARSTVSSSLVQGAGQVAGGLLGWGAIGLAGGYLAGRVWCAAQLLDRIPRGGWAGWWATAHRWRQFCLLSTGPAVLNTLSVAAVSPIVAACYGVTVSGLFAFATRILTLPTALVGQAVSAVLYPKLAQLDRDGGDLRDAVDRTASGLAMLAVPCFGLVAVAGPELFAAAFGDRWRQAGVLAAVLAPWLAASFVSSPLSTLMTVKNELRRLLLLSGVETAVRVGALAIGVAGGGPTVGVACYAAAGTAISVYYVRWSLRLVGVPLRVWLRRRWLFLSAAGVSYPLLLAVKGHLPGLLFAAGVVVVTVAMLGWAGAWLYRQAPARPAAPAAARQPAAVSG